MQKIKQQGISSLAIILIIAVVLGIGGGWYYYMNKGKNFTASDEHNRSPIVQPEVAKNNKEKLRQSTVNDIETENQQIKFKFPAGNLLENENLKLSSIYGRIDVKGSDIKTQKTLAIQITNVDKGQILMLFKKDVSSGKFKYNIPIYIKKTNSVYAVDAISIAKGYVWMSMAGMNKSIKPILMEKISNDNMVTVTMKGEIEYLLRTNPKEVGGDFMGERGERLVRLAAKIVENNLEKKAAPSDTASSYKDCGSSKTCLSEKALTCSLAKGIISEAGITIEHIINGEKNGKCLYSSKILSGFGLAGLELSCELDKTVLANSFNTGLNRKLVTSSCSGSYIDYMKKINP